MHAWLQKNADLGIFFFRLFIGARIVYGVVDNVLSWDKMVEFSRFLEAHHFPLPIFAAMLSVYAQLTAGLLLLAGWFTRVASLLLIVNFIVALLGVHTHDTVEAMTPPLSMLFGALLLFFTGPGRFAIDNTQ